MSCIVFKRIVLPESNLIYQIYKGITPGHGMTNIINTVCIYGTFVTTFNKCLKGKRELSRTKLIIAGDDVIGNVHISKVTVVSNKLKFCNGMLQHKFI